MLDLIDYVRQPTSDPADPGQPGGLIDGGTDERSLFRSQVGYGSYRSLFRRDGVLETGGFDSFREFIGAVMAGGGDRRLTWQGDEGPGEKRVVRAMGESQPSTGGFLVPEQWASEILDVALEDAIVMPRARVYPMKSNTLHLPGWDIGSHASNLYGGVTCSWKEEGGSITAANPVARECQLTAHKLTAYVETSNELKADVENFESDIVGMRGQVQIAASPHVLFTTDQTAWRAIVRVDGQGTWDEALTPAESTDTFSPFVTLAERS